MIRIRVFPIIKKKIRVFLKNQLNGKAWRKKKEILQKKKIYIYIYIFLEKKKKKKKRIVGCHILIGVIVANLNFSSGLVDVKWFSGCEVIL